MLLEWEVDGRQQSFALPSDGRTTLGRSAECTVVLSHPTVSRQHAEIYAQAAGFSIRNLSRTNLVFLEHQGQVARLGYGQQTTLPAGAHLYLGSVQVRSKPALPTLRLRCSGPCGKVVEVPRSGFCPHCGTALATADTFVG